MGDIPRPKLVCHTCETFKPQSNPPYLQNQLDSRPPTARGLRYLADTMEKFFASYWFNTRGEWVASLRGAANWRDKHKGHNVEVYEHNRSVPAGYTEERL